MPFPGLQRHCMHLAQGHACRQSSYTYKAKSLMRETKAVVTLKSGVRRTFLPRASKYKPSRKPSLCVFPSEIAQLSRKPSLCVFPPEIAQLGRNSGCVLAVRMSECYFGSSVLRALTSTPLDGL